MTRARLFRSPLLSALPLVLAAVGCRPSTEPSPDALKIGAYSVVREVFHDGLIPAFRAKWKAETGRDAVFEESYNASGAQARQIASGFDADLAVLSHSGDMELLVKSGKVKPDWNAGPRKGILTNSLVVIGHREGNPKSIHDWSDLARPGVGVLYPDPKTSGGARWNINAIYGSALLDARGEPGGNQESIDLASIHDLLARVQRNVVNMDQSGRQSMTNFAERKIGDAVVTYENELRLRAREGSAVPYVVPPATLLIEGPAAIVDGSVARHGNGELAAAFVAFLYSDEGQAIFADYGFRRLGQAAATPPAPTRLFTAADLGGWEALEERLYSTKGLWTAVAAEQVRNRGR